MTNLKGTKRERLLDWIRNGDPRDVPILLGLSNFEVASAKFGKDQREITWPEAIRAAEETGTHLLGFVAGPLPFDAIPFLDDIAIHEVKDTSPDGAPRFTKTITTPEGTLTEIRECPADKGEYHRKFFVSTEKEIPAFAYLIRRTTDAVVKDPAIRKKVGEGLRVGKEAVGGNFPSLFWVFCPGVELTCSIYMDQETAINLLYDQPDLMDELMQRHWEMTKVWLALGEEHDVDICGYSINGFEWLSPDLYERYMIPQARRINEMVEAQGKISWLHTCGKMKRIADMGAYRRMKIRVLESLSLPPTGDIENLAETRRIIGRDVVTRGGINCELLYDPDLKALRDRTRHVLESVAGFKHILGDTNPSYPSYPWENIQTVIDTVRETGRLFE
jgi:uroporphyrinogen-III decarboxylase